MHKTFYLTHIFCENQMCPEIYKAANHWSLISVFVIQRSQSLNFSLTDTLIIFLKGGFIQNVKVQKKSADDVKG